MRKLFILFTLFSIPFLASAHNGEEEAVSAPTDALVTLIASHVIVGLVGIMALYLIWMGFLKKEPKISFLKWTSVVAAVSLVISWITGGYYYVVYYGEAVKPVIKEGSYAWAHAVLMETKEHVFLFLPAVAVLFAVVFFWGGDMVTKNAKLRGTLAFIAAVATLIGIFITLAGVLISGATQ